MKKRFLVSCLIGLSACALVAQESELDAVKRQLKEATELFQKTMEQQRQVIESLSKKVNALEAAATNQQSVVTQAGSTNVLAPNGTTPLARRWSLADPIRLFGSGQNYINLSFDGLFTAGTSTAKD